MESNSSPSVNLLAYLRSKSSIDYDALSLQVATDLGPFVDCTSNQWEAYSQLSNGENAALVRESVDLARRLELADVSVKELAVEIAMIRLSLRVAPLISGSIHVMCNPLYSWDTEQVFETGHRFHKLCRILDPDFELSRLVMKVPSTWQGLRACGRLGADGIKTLATTLFTMEQVVLAGEAGCVSVSPFAHELRAHLDPSYHDSAPVLDLVSRAQQYYRQHGIPTKVKACALMTTDEIISLAGVDAMTLPAEVLRELASLTDSQEGLEARSVFRGAAPAPVPRLSYMDDEAGFLRAFTANGRGKAKTEDALAIFCGFQMQAEELMTSEMED
ncbi:hypothetical protein G6O67_005631 [Ophiocordyceps sinensis]|uniref:Transaldolase n=1 Tax=Ophiocordyceps sinensis TaxID=72228 RepID=A0A8H4PPA0_9HYPO|nr:hypothetical protein G6O67_005631 [Ophiocordyceps sinensis]